VLARVLHQRGQIDRAAEVYSGVLSGFEKELGEDHSSTVDCKRLYKCLREAQDMHKETLQSWHSLSDRRRGRSLSPELYRGEIDANGILDRTGQSSLFSEGSSPSPDNSQYIRPYSTPDLRDAKPYVYRQESKLLKK
jgi:hypothetical protein